METDADLERLLFPKKQEQVSLRRMPDFVKVSKELTRSGATLKLSGWSTVRSAVSWVNNPSVFPARVRKPKDKSGAEGTVGVVSTRIIVALR